MKSESAAIDIPESSSVAKRKAPLIAVSRNAKGGYRKGIAIFDLILRLAAIATALAAAAAMGTSGETLPFFTQFFQFFVIAITIVGGYLVLSLPFSVVAIVRPHAVGPRLLLIILDAVALTLNTAAGAAAAAIVYLAHNGNSNTNWLAICSQYGDFCQKVSGAVVASFLTVVIFVFLIVLSAFALRRH
ncbi:hypothetical protein NC651_016782 [Populus alba x Populus x berolinensis]|nr:hypothetical protein NC651_016782 [Populus alba x Populus x berolinensis]